MERFEAVVLDEQPNIVLVVGDVNSTAACAMVAKKTWCDDGTARFIPKLAHVEAGLRSFDRSMPEEINRIVTDSISDYLFTTEESANHNLIREGISENRVFFVGNVMIDTLLRHRAKAERSTILNDLHLAHGPEVKPYAVLTLHRPANVDDRQVFAHMLDALVDISRRMTVIFPAHPRTVKRVQDEGLGGYFVDNCTQEPAARDAGPRIRLVPPLGYLDFLHLMSRARVVLTDSGGIQEETTILGVPCITLRDSTERPVTIECGTNVLVGSDPEKIVAAFERVHRNNDVVKGKPPRWDGHAADRIIKVLVDDFYRS
jgi:UDP-N-acetylglucosamine 2-epimerase (non-hydrolysing)